MSNRKEGTSLWWVGRIDGTDGHFFTGSLHAMVRHINELHLASDVQHCARQLEYPQPPQLGQALRREPRP